MLQITTTNKQVFLQVDNYRKIPYYKGQLRFRLSDTGDRFHVYLWPSENPFINVPVSKGVTVDGVELTYENMDGLLEDIAPAEGGGGPGNFYSTTDTLSADAGTDTVIDVSTLTPVPTEEIPVKSGDMVMDGAGTNATVITVTDTTAAVRTNPDLKAVWGRISGVMEDQADLDGRFTELDGNKANKIMIADARPVSPQAGAFVNEIHLSAIAGIQVEVDSGGVPEIIAGDTSGPADRIFDPAVEILSITNTTGSDLAGIASFYVYEGTVLDLADIKSGLENNIDTLEDSKIGKSDLPDPVTGLSSDLANNKLTLTTKNMAANVTSSTDITLSVASEDNNGLMPKEAYAVIYQNQSEIDALKHQGGKFIGQSFNTKALLDAYVIPGTVNAGDFTYVLDDETHNDATTRYIVVNTGTEQNPVLAFGFGYVINYDPIGLGNTAAPGIVMGSLSAGQVFIEADGTMSLNGWDSLAALMSDFETLSAYVNYSKYSVTVSSVGSLNCSYGLITANISSPSTMTLSNLASIPVSKECIIRVNNTSPSTAITLTLPTTVTNDYGEASVVIPPGSNIEVSLFRFSSSLVSMKVGQKL